MENHEKIYEKTKNNSIGPDKKAPAKRTKKSIATTISISLLIMTLAASGLAHYLGVSTKKTTIDNQPTIEIEYKNEYNGYKTREITTFARLRAIDFLKEHGITEYVTIEDRRDYKYSAEDYKKISELDESYLSALYTLTTPETFNEFLKALGYTNLDDFLISNNYLDSKGKASTRTWRIFDLEKISTIMKNMTEEKRQTK